MASAVEPTNNVTAVDPANADAGTREIPADRVTYSQAAAAEGEGDASGEFEQALIDGALGFMASQIHGMVTRGASEAKRMQDEVHAQLKEAENENAG